MYPEVLRDFVFCASAQQQASSTSTDRGGRRRRHDPIPATVGAKYELTLFGWAGALRAVAACLVAGIALV